jgi:hypothetical protein
MRIIAALLIGLLASGPAVMATTLMQMNFVEISRAADGILIGTVAEIASERADNGIIYSFVTLDELEVVRGNFGGERFTLRLEGGQVDGEVQHIEGAPRFREGERVIVFVDGNGRNIVPVAGWTQGLFRIVSGPDEEEEFVVDALGNRVLGIRDGEIVKESRYGSEAELVGGAAGGLERSETPQFDPGDVQGGQLLRPEESTVGPMMEFTGSIGEAMTLDAFREQLTAQIQAAEIGAPTGTLSSVEPGSLPRPTQADAPAPAQAVDREPPTLLPSERGTTPRRIERPREDGDE